MVLRRKTASSAPGAARKVSRPSAAPQTPSAAADPASPLGAASSTAAAADPRNIAKRLVKNVVKRAKDNDQIRVDWLVRMAPPVIYFPPPSASIRGAAADGASAFGEEQVADCAGYLDALLGPASLKVGRPLLPGQPVMDLDRERMSLRRGVKVIAVLLGRCRQFVASRRTAPLPAANGLTEGLKHLASRMVNAQAALSPLFSLSPILDTAAMTMMPYPVDPDDPDLPMSRDGMPLATQTRRLVSFWGGLTRARRAAIIQSERKAYTAAKAAKADTGSRAWCVCPHCASRRMTLDDLCIQLGTAYLEELDRLTAAHSSAGAAANEEPDAKAESRRHLYHALVHYSESLLANHVSILDQPMLQQASGGTTPSTPRLYATAKEMVSEFHKQRGSKSHRDHGPCAECQKLRRDQGLPGDADCAPQEDDGYSDDEDGLDEEDILDYDSAEFEEHDDDLDLDEGDLLEDGGSSSDELVPGFPPIAVEHFPVKLKASSSSRMMAASNSPATASAVPSHPLESSYRGVCCPLDPDDILEAWTDPDLTRPDPVPHPVTRHPYPLTAAASSGSDYCVEGARLLQMVVSELFSHRLSKEYQEALVLQRQAELLAEVEREELASKSKEVVKQAAKARKKERQKQARQQAAVFEEEVVEETTEVVPEEIVPERVVPERVVPEGILLEEAVLEMIVPEEARQGEAVEPAKLSSGKKKKRRQAASSAPAVTPTPPISDREQAPSEDDNAAGAVARSATGAPDEASDDDPSFLLRTSIEQLQLTEEDELEAHSPPKSSSRFESLFTAGNVRPPGFSTSSSAAAAMNIWSATPTMPAVRPGSSTLFSSATSTLFGPNLLAKSMILSEEPLQGNASSSSSNPGTPADDAPPGLASVRTQPRK